MDITDKIAIITGASGGIGLATARLFAERGARVALAARSAKRIQQLAAELPGSLALPTDMRDTAAVRQMIAQVQQHYGRIDMLINNAGQGMHVPVVEADLDQYRAVFELNVVSVLNAIASLTKAQLTEATGGSDSIFALLVHMVDVQRTWLARAQHTVALPLDPASCSTLAALRAAWQRVDEASSTYVTSLNTDDLAEIVRYANTKGEPQAYPRWHILLHQALHDAQHRSEAALLLSALGHSTGWLDYLIYIDETRAA